MVKREDLLAPVLCAMAGVWVFLAWRLAGMPDPGGMGRMLPLTWFLCGLMCFHCRDTKFVLISMVVFTVFCILWRVLPLGHHAAAAASVAGVIAMGLRVSGQRFGVLRGILPVFFLAVIVLPFTSDEVRFAEIAGDITGVRGYTFITRPGDPSPGDSHHTPVFPLMISPGLPFGTAGIRVMGFLPVLACALLMLKLLRRHSMPSPEFIAVAAVFMMPGFTLLGPALTGWTAAAVICGYAVLPRGRTGLAVTILLSVFLVALKMRFVGAAAGMIAVAYLENTGKAKGRFLVPLGVAAFLFLAIAGDRLLLGGRLIWLRYGTPETVLLLVMNTIHNPRVMLFSAVNMLFDAESGLLPKAPWVIAALAALPVLYRKHRDVFFRLAVPGVLYTIVHLVWTGEAWHGLPAPSTRVFMPLLPLFAVSLSAVLARKTSRLLIGVSLAVSALILVVPESRFNMASGSDNLMNLFQARGMMVSMLRPSGMAAAFWLFFGMTGVFMASRDSMTGMKVLFLSGALAMALPGNRGRTEAENAEPPLVHGALLYPENPDPALRSLWLFSKQRLLMLDHPDQHLFIQRGRRLFIRASGGPGALLVIDGDTIDVHSPLLPIPEILAQMGRHGIAPDRPENRAMREYSLDIRESAYLRVPMGGAPVFIDWLEVLE